MYSVHLYILIVFYWNYEKRKLCLMFEIKVVANDVCARARVRACVNVRYTFAHNSIIVNIFL